MWFNGTWGIGEYAYQDMLSDGTVMNGTIIVVEDVHIENSTAPAIGSSFGTFENNNGDDGEDDGNEEDDVRQMLLLIGAGSGLGAAALLVLLLMRRSEDDATMGSDEEA